MRAMTDAEIQRARKRWWDVRRYKVVHDLRQTGYSEKGYPKEHALDQAVINLRAEGDKGVKRRGKLDEGISRDAVERSYNKVKQDLERRGRESQYYHLVNKINEGPSSRAGRGPKGGGGAICSGADEGGHLLGSRWGWWIR